MVSGRVNLNGGYTARMRAWSALVVVLVMSLQQPEPPAILQIYRVSLKPGAEAAFDAIERQIATLCATLKCPHPYLGLESVTGPQEVWFLNGYRSADEQKRSMRRTNATSL